MKRIFCLFALLGLTPFVSADSHFFPRLRSLFVGLDESRIAGPAKNSLLQAKTDFERARHDESPRFASYVGPGADLHVKVYQGRGYRLQVVHEEAVHSRIDGPEIFLESSVTGGAPFHYSEVEVITE